MEPVAALSYRGIMHRINAAFNPIRPPVSGVVEEVSVGDSGVGKTGKGSPQ